MNALRILALILAAIILVPAGAHLLELPAKMAMDRDAYFTVQSIYAGWALFGAPIFLSIGVNVALFVALRRSDPVAAGWALAAALLVVASLVLFFVRVFPANQSTRNWTVRPENWEALRTAWEYGHAINFALVFAAFVAIAIAAVRRPADSGRT